MTTELLQSVRYGVRMLVRRPGLSLAAVLTLALGIGANTAIFSVVNGVLLRPLPFLEPERIVSLAQVNLDEGERIPVSPPVFLDWRENLSAFEYFGVSASTNFILTGGEPERVVGAYVSEGFLETLGVRPLLGRGVSRVDEVPGGERLVLLSHGLWQRRYGGDTALLGTTLSVNGREHTVAGVLPSGFRYPDDAEVWVPLVLGEQELTQRRSHYLDAVARVKPGVTLEQASADLERVAQLLASRHPESDSSVGASAIPLHELIVGDVRPALMVLLVAVAFVLLIACANVASLMLMGATARRREMAIRAALGARRWTLVRQLLIESLLLSGAGGLIGLLLAMWGVDVLRALGPDQLPRLNEVGIDSGVLGFTFAASLVTGVLFGIAPALRASRIDVNEALKEGGVRAAGRTASRGRAALVVAEVALALVLLAGAGLMVRTLLGLINTLPGFEPSGVLTAELFLAPGKYSTDEQRALLQEQVLARIAALPGVESAAATTNLPLARGGMVYALLIEGRPEPGPGDKPIRANFRAVSPDFFDTMRIPLLGGRGVSGRDVAGSPDVVVIDQAMAESLWPGENPIGKRVRIARGRQPAWREIVGIVGNTRHAGLHEPPAPTMYVPYAQQPLQFFRLAVRTSGDRALLAGALRKAAWAADPDQPVSRILPMVDVVGRSMSETRFYSSLLSVFSVVALALAGVGVYGLLAHSVVQRTHEIGVRMALGAQRSSIFAMVMANGAMLLAIGIALGLAGSYVLTRFLSSLLLNVSPTDGTTFAVVTAVLAIAGLLACYWPARRATRVDPMQALRYE